MGDHQHREAGGGDDDDSSIAGGDNGTLRRRDEATTSIRKTLARHDYNTKKQVQRCPVGSRVVIVASRWKKWSMASFSLAERGRKGRRHSPDRVSASSEIS
jgi:hypothetical protein